MISSKSQRRWALFVCLAVSTAVCLAADELPKAEAILDKYVSATGGRAAYEKIKTEITEGQLEMFAQGMKGKMIITRADPNKNLTVMEIEGVGKIEQGTDGTYGWDRSALQGTRLVEGDELEMRLRSSANGAVTNWKKYYTSAETKGSDKVGEQECWLVEMTPKAGRPETRCYDKKTGLMLRSAMIVKTPMGEIPAESFFADYRDEGGVKVPHTLKQKVMGQEIAFTVLKVSINPALPPNTFAIPDDVKALIDKAKSAPAAEPAKKQ